MARHRPDPLGSPLQDAGDRLGARRELFQEGLRFSKVGGVETSRFGPRDGPVYLNEAHYLDIVPDQRIVSAGCMTSGGQRIFAGMLTVEFRPAGRGCRMVMTEQGAFLDAHDVPANHQAGWNRMLDNLRGELDRRSTAA